MANTYENAACELRQSRYTTAIPNGGDLLLYNAASGSFMVADEAMAACFSSCGELHPELADQLVADRFLTALSAEEEFDEQCRLFAAQRQDPNVLKIAYGLTYACNCRCAYCYEQDKIVGRERMSRDTVAAVFRFIQKRFADRPFKKLLIEWYGGEPTLCLDIIRDAAAQLIEWCRENDVEYDSMVLSNGVLLDEDAAALFAEAQVRSVYLTIDGPKDIHNARRPAIGCDDPFERNIEAIAALQAHGIKADAAMNTDKVNAKRFEEIKTELAERFGVSLNPVKLNDYAHSYGCSGTFGGPGSLSRVQDAEDPDAKSSFGPPDFELYTHPEFARQQFEWLASSNPSADEIAVILRPAAYFCAGQLDNYFVIDALGDVYKCDGWMGDPNYRICNLLDGSADVLLGLDESVPERDATGLRAITFDPCEDERCAPCNLLPLCWGNCIWERTQTGMPCHPLKTTLPDYLRLWASLQ